MEIEKVGETTASMLYTTLVMISISKMAGSRQRPLNLVQNSIVLVVKFLWLVSISVSAWKNWSRYSIWGVMSYVVLIKIIQRIGFKKACIALANKIVRIAWAMLRYETAYKTILLNAD